MMFASDANVSHLSFVWVQFCTFICCLCSLALVVLRRRQQAAGGRVLLGRRSARPAYVFVNRSASPFVGLFRLESALLFRLKLSSVSLCDHVVYRFALNFSDPFYLLVALICVIDGCDRDWISRFRAFAHSSQWTRTFSRRRWTAQPPTRPRRVLCCCSRACFWSFSIVLSR
jgi:hypothetical protein